MPQGRGRKLRGSFFCDPLQEAVCENGKPFHFHKPLAEAMGYLIFRQGLLSSMSNISAGLGSACSLHNYGQVSLSLSPYTPAPRLHTQQFPAHTSHVTRPFEMYSLPGTHILANRLSSHLRQLVRKRRLDIEKV